MSPVLLFSPDSRHSGPITHPKDVLVTSVGPSYDRLEYYLSFWGLLLDTPVLVPLCLLTSVVHQVMIPLL